MSELQLSLLAIGVVVVIGVYAFNWFQERRFQKRVEAAFRDKHEDVLLRDREAAPAASPAASPTTRIEPTLPDPDPEPVTVPVEAIPAPVRPVAAAAAAPEPDGGIDCIAVVEFAEPVPGSSLEAVIGAARGLEKPAMLSVRDAATGAWEPVAAAGACSALRIAMQLSNRKGPVSDAGITALADLASSAAASLGGTARLPDVAASAARARELDQFCIDADIAVGLNVIASTGATFGGKRVQEAADAAGFRLDPAGPFVLHDEGGRVLFTLDNQDPQRPFRADSLATATTRGVTLLLDVPRVPDGVAAFDRMTVAGKRVAEVLGGTLVDDNRVALSDAGMERIRAQLRAVCTRMEAAGIAPGSEQALRLFS